MNATCLRCGLPAEALDICDTCLRYICNERIHYQRVADELTAHGLCAWSVDRLMVDLLGREDERPDHSREDQPKQST